MPTYQGSTNGFKRSGTLISGRIRKVTETRGFAVSRVLTHWSEIVGEEIAAIARPVDITYGRQGLGATLTLLTTGAQAPMLEMQKEMVREKVNAAYGYNAISRVRLTQTAPTGFAEGQAEFTTGDRQFDHALDEVTKERASTMSRGVQDEKLRNALEAFAQNYMKKRDLEK